LIFDPFSLQRHQTTVGEKLLVTRKRGKIQKLPNLAVLNRQLLARHKAGALLARARSSYPLCICTRPQHYQACKPPLSFLSRIVYDRTWQREGFPVLCPNPVVIWIYKALVGCISAPSLHPHVRPCLFIEHSLQPLTQEGSRILQPSPCWLFGISISAGKSFDYRAHQRRPYLALSDRSITDQSSQAIYKGAGQLASSARTGLCRCVARDLIRSHTIPKTNFTLARIHKHVICEPYSGSMHRMNVIRSLAYENQWPSPHEQSRQALVKRKDCTFYPSFNIISPESSFVASPRSGDDDLPSPRSTLLLPLSRLLGRSTMPYYPTRDTV
jgi:hypothetical protein